MAELLKAFITGKLDLLKGRQFDEQGERDLNTLVGYVTPSLAQFFTTDRIGPVDEMETSQDLDGSRTALERLLAKKGNSLNKISNTIINRQGLENLTANREARNTFQAIILGSLNRLQNPDIK